MIPNQIRNEVSAVALRKFDQLTEDQQRSFLEDYYRHRKSTGLAFLCWLFFGLHYAYLGRWGWQVVFWLCLGGFFLWWIIDLFRLSGMTSTYNGNLSTKIMHDVVSIG